MSAVGRAGGTCLSSMIAAPTFPRTVPRTSTLQRQSRTSVAADNNAVVDSNVAAYHQRPLVDGPLSQTGSVAAASRHTQQNATGTDRFVLLATHMRTIFPCYTLTLVVVSTEGQQNITYLLTYLLK